MRKKEDQEPIHTGTKEHWEIRGDWGGCRAHVKLRTWAELLRGGLLHPPTQCWMKDVETGSHTWSFLHRAHSQWHTPTWKLLWVETEREKGGRKLSPVASCTEQRQGAWISISPSWGGYRAGVRRPVKLQQIILTFSEINSNSKDTA